MDEIRRALGEAVGSFNPDPEPALEATARGGRKRHLIRQIFTGVTALAISGVLFGASWALFRGDAGERPSGPAPGPSPNAAASPTFPVEPRLQKDTEVFLVDEGVERGARWELRAQGATLTFPDRQQRMLCIGLWIEGWPRPGGEIGCSYPISETGYGGYASLPSAGRPGDPPVTAVFSGTSSETSELLLDLSSGPTLGARLYGPFPEIGDAKIYLAFMSPRDYPSRFRALDDAGRVIWEHEGRPSPNVTLGVSGAGTGTVGAGSATSNPDAFREVIQCPPRCLYEVGTPMKITFVAHPGTGSSFAGWNGPCVDQPDHCTIRVASDLEVEAIFETTG